MANGYDWMSNTPVNDEAGPGDAGFASMTSTPQWQNNFGNTSYNQPYSGYQAQPQTGQQWWANPTPPNTQAIQDQFTAAGFADTGNWLNEEWSSKIGDDYAEKYLYPSWDRQQASYQYAKDFNEAKERFNAQYGLDLSDLQFSQYMSQRQQGAQENQFSQQFGFQQQQWRDTLPMLQQDRATQQHLADTQRQLADVERAYRSGLISNQQYANETGRIQANFEREVGLAQAGAQRYGAELGLQGQLGAAGMYSSAQRYGSDVEREVGLGANAASMYRSDAEKAVGMAQVGAQEKQNEILRMWYAGQLTNEQARLAMEQAQGLTREEQMRMQAEQLRSQELQSRYAAFGRAQAPNARWARNW